MPDNVTYQSATPATPPAGTVVSTEDITTLNGGAVTAQQLQRVALGLRTADAIAIDLPGEATFGLDVDVTRSALPTGAAADATIGTTNTRVGDLTEPAPATDTASSGLNGRLQRIAQRLTSLIALLPAALVGGRLDVNLGAAPASVTVTATDLDVRNLASSQDSVRADPTQGSLTNRSGSITSGGTSQQLAASNASRKYLLVQNIATEDLWFNFGVAAVSDQPSVRLRAGDAFEMQSLFVSTEAINIIGATTGSKFVAKEG